MQADAALCSLVGRHQITRSSLGTASPSPLNRFVRWEDVRHGGSKFIVPLGVESSISTAINPSRPSSMLVVCGSVGTLVAWGQILMMTIQAPLSHSSRSCGGGDATRHGPPRGWEAPPRESAAKQALPAYCFDCCMLEVSPPSSRVDYSRVRTPPHRTDSTSLSVVSNSGDRAIPTASKACCCTTAAGCRTRRWRAGAEVREDDQLARAGVLVTLASCRFRTSGGLDSVVDPSSFFQ